MSDHEHDAFIDEIASELKRPVRFSENFDARVMSAIRTSHLSVVQGSRAQSAPGSRRVLVPALASLAAAATLAIVLMRSDAPNGTMMATDPSVVLVNNTAEERVFLQDVKLTIYLPKAQSVAVMGAFNDWDASRSPMERNDDGTWTITLRLVPGSYEYQFLADGMRMTDPSAPATDSEFGEANSVLTVTPRVAP